MPRAQILSFEEIARIARLAVHGLGVSKIRLTGGEPLLRRELPALVRMLARIDGVRDLTLTTNGYLLEQHAQALADAGLQRVTVSLDALDAATFARMSGATCAVERMLAGIAAARSRGLSADQDQLRGRARPERARDRAARAPLSRHAAVVRFIEFMDVGTLNALETRPTWSAPSEIRAHVERVCPLERSIAAEPRRRVAERFRYARRQRRGRHHRGGHAPVLRRLQPRAALRRRPLHDVPVRRADGISLRDRVTRRRNGCELARS